MGDVCSWDCKFGTIKKKLFSFDPEEPSNAAWVASDSKIRHVAITSVTRNRLSLTERSPSKANFSALLG